MKSTPDNHAHGDFTHPGEVRLVRLLPGPVEMVWEFLVDPAKRARWFCGGVTELRSGGRVDIVMRHADFAAGEAPPERYREIHEKGKTFTGRVARCEPPRLLSYTFGGEDSEVTFELIPQGRQVLLVLTHRAKGEDLPGLGNYASGWHSHLGQLVAVLEGTPRPAFWATHLRLVTEYEQLMAKAP